MVWSVKFMTMPKHCCYGKCNSDSRYPVEAVFFIRFPKPWHDVTKCKKWIQACKRENFGVENIKNHTYICSVHFVGGNGPTPDHPDPVADPSARKYNARVSERKNLKRAVPEILPHREHSEEDTDEEEDADEEENTDEEEDTDEEEAQAILLQENASTSFTEHGGASTSSAQCNSFSKTVVKTSNKSTETDMQVENMYIKNLKREVVSLKEQLFSCALRFDNFKRDEKKLKFYTGLNHQQFEVLWEFLGPNREHLKLWEGEQSLHTSQYTPQSRWDKKDTNKGNKLTPKDMLLLTLMRLRCGLLEEDLAYRFHLSQGYVSKIIITWIQFLYLHFKDLSIFPSRTQIKRKNIPKAFRKFKNIRVILDGFEVNTQKPSDYREQGNMYSSYKSHATFKFILGIIPTGGICFMSEAYEGSMSDRDIFLKCNLLDKLENEDSIMVDKGFNIQDICNERKVTVIIPPFLRGRSQLTKEEVLITRNIASARIHVERAVCAVKQFRLLQKVLPKNLIPSISQIAFVIACLVNFQERLVN